VGALDFYESLGCLTLVHSSLEQSFEEMLKLHPPENGMAESCLENALVISAHAKLKVLRG
jgi:hypothetical protein